MNFSENIHYIFSYIHGELVLEQRIEMKISSNDFEHVLIRRRNHKNTQNNNLSSALRQQTSV